MLWGEAPLAWRGGAACAFHEWVNLGGFGCLGSGWVRVRVRVRAEGLGLGLVKRQPLTTATTTLLELQGKRRGGFPLSRRRRRKERRRTPKCQTKLAPFHPHTRPTMHLPVVGKLGPLSEEEKEFPPKSFSFAAAGWLKIYYWGVAKALQVHGLADNAQFIGSSAGSLASCGLVLGCDFDEIKEVSCKKVEECHGGFLPAFQLRTYVRSVLGEVSVVAEWLDVGKEAGSAGPCSCEQASRQAAGEN